VSPIWQPSIESQAIKRAHRIGQTRPVFVETLVLRGTLEEKILRRRRQMSNAELVRAEKSLLDDRTMNATIREEGFLKIRDEDKIALKGGRLEVPVPLFERRDIGGFGVGGLHDVNDLIFRLEDEHVTKKRKKDKGSKLAPRRSVAFAASPAPAGGSTSRPETPSLVEADTPRADQVQEGAASSFSSVFGVHKPKKSVRIMVDDPPSN